MSNFDLTFCKVYIYAKGWPGINLGAWHESCSHPNVDVFDDFNKGNDIKLQRILSGVNLWVSFSNRAKSIHCSVLWIEVPHKE